MKILAISAMWIVFGWLFSLVHCTEIAQIDPDEDNVLEVNQYNYQDILDYVQSKKGILLLHTYKDHCAA